MNAAQEMPNEMVHISGLHKFTKYAVNGPKATGGISPNAPAERSRVAMQNKCRMHQRVIVE